LAIGVDEFIGSASRAARPVNVTVALLISSPLGVPL